MSELVTVRFRAEIEWLETSPYGPIDWRAFPALRASIAFADARSNELFSSSGTAAARIDPETIDRSTQFKIESLITTHLVEYLAAGEQFLVLRGKVCVGVGLITNVLVGDTESPPS